MDEKQLAAVQKQMFEDINLLFRKYRIFIEEPLIFSFLMTYNAQMLARRYTKKGRKILCDDFRDTVEKMAVIIHGDNTDDE